MESTGTGDSTAFDREKIVNVIGVNRGTSVQAGHVYINSLVNGPDEPALERLLDAVDERRRTSGAVRRRTLPPSLPWVQRSACLGRSRELAELRTQLSAGRHVLIGGPAGIGKTLLLQHATSAGVLSADTVPGCEGVLRQLLVPGMTPDDVLHELTLECYDVEPQAPVSPRRLLSRICALVVLDGVEWPAEGIQQVLDAMPGSVFVIAARRTDSSPSVKSLPLGGLSFADGLRLWENELGTSLSDAEKRRAERVHDSCGGNPGKLGRFAAALRTAGVQGSASEVADPDVYAMVVDRALSKIGEPAVTALKELLIFPDASWGEELLATIGRGNPADLRKLEDARLIECESGRYRVGPDVADVVPPPAPWQLFDRITSWAHAETDAERIAAELGVIERTLRRLLGDDRHWDAVALARVVSVRLLPTPWWNRGDEVLGLGLRAARRAGSRTDTAYFTYALAARRADGDRAEEAAELLVALIDSAREHGARRLADRARELRDTLPTARVAAPEPVPGRGAEAVSQLILRVPVLNSATDTALTLAREHPAVLRKAVAGVLLLAGALFGLPASAGAPASATGAPSSSSGLGAPIAPRRPSEPPAAGASPSVAPPPPAPPPAGATPAPTAGATAPSSRPPGARPGQGPAAAADGTTSTDRRHTAGPDLTGKWRLVLVRRYSVGVYMNPPDTYTITLHRLDDDRCGEKAPCYGGQWGPDGPAASGNFVAAASPTSFFATDSDAHGEQTYRGELISGPGQPPQYKGGWTGGGRTASFVFTRLG
ncbi:hypothetical protein AB0M80_20975 [Amycolatopsis sp. NPDC051045]|uniref:hypothetical protein n=1 Tax=Amycolatopsis sp. NPDC051045 TaxID=3156922 RepID=UPI00341BA541